MIFFSFIKLYWNYSFLYWI